MLVKGATAVVIYEGHKRQRDTIPSVVFQYENSVSPYQMKYVSYIYMFRRGKFYNKRLITFGESDQPMKNRDDIR